MSVAPLGPTDISLEDARLLVRLRRGEPGSLEALWARSKHDLWSVCAAMTDDLDEARRVLRDLYDGLWHDTRGWRADTHLCCHLAAYAWRRLGVLLELPPLTGIDRNVPATLDLPDPSDLPARVAALTPAVRLVYLLDLFFGCPLQVLSTMTSIPEAPLRDARAHATFSLLRRG